MQMQLPIFPAETKLINACVGVFERDDFVYYLHNGSPVFCHQKDDLHNYRYITANLVNNGLCRCSEIAQALGVSTRNIERYSKALREKGSEYFFNREEKRGSGYKLKDEDIAYAQKMINDFYSVSDVARLMGITEGTLRYYIKKGTIKKKWSLR
jgi:biotin operon repressor